MTEIGVEVAFKATRRVVLFVALIALTLGANLLPFDAIPPAAASPVAGPGALSLGLDGAGVLPVVGVVNASLNVSENAAPLPALIASTTNSITLGAPMAAGTITLGDCSSWGFLICSVDKLKDIPINAYDCVKSLVKLTGILQGICGSFAPVLGSLETLAMWTISGTVAKVARTVAQSAQSSALNFSMWILRDELGGQNVTTTPVLSCHIAQGVQKTSNCKDSWFLGQYEIMRQIALFLLLPLFMLVVIQSIIKGSLYMLLRSALIMLPVSIIGAVVAVFFAQLLLNLSDDFVGMISSYTASTTAYSTQFQTSVSGMDATKLNYFAVVWLIILLAATAIIYIELLLRQLGVYMAAFFLPLAFSALVWPASGRFAKKMLELLIGLIFSKVFIATAVSLGIAAFANVAQSGSTTIPGAANDATTAGLTSLISGTLIFCTAAFVGTKVLQISPAAMTAAEGRIVQTSNYATKFQLTKIGMDRATQLQNWRNNNRRSSNDFNTGPPGRVAPPQIRRGPNLPGQGVPAPAPPRARRR